MDSSERKQRASDGSNLADVPTDPERSSAERSSRCPPDIVSQLWFDQFQHISTLATAATAAGLILLQTPYLEVTVRSSIAVAVFVLAAAVALIGQTKLIDRIEHNRDIGTVVRVYRIVTLALMGAGVGLFVAIMTSYIKHDIRGVIYPI